MWSVFSLDCLQETQGNKKDRKGKREAHSEKQKTERTEEKNKISGKNNEFKNEKKNSGLKRNGEGLSSEREEL